MITDGGCNAWPKQTSNFCLFLLVSRCISLGDIISRLGKGYVAIVLVNSNILICNWCELNCTNKVLLFTSCVFSLGQNEFCGHYVVLCGFDMEKRCVYYKNPSFDDDLCCAKFGSFEAARQSYGTDEDIIFVRVEDTFTMKENMTSIAQQICR